MQTMRGYRRKPDFRRPGRTATPSWLKSLAVTATAMAAITLCGAVLMDATTPHQQTAPAIKAPEFGSQLAVSCAWQAVAPGADLPPSEATPTGTVLRITTNHGFVSVGVLGVPSCAMTSIAHLAGTGAYSGVPCTRPTGEDAFLFRCPSAQDPGYRLTGSNDATVRSLAGVMLLDSLPTGELLIVSGDRQPLPAYSTLGVVMSGSEIITAAARPGAVPLVIHSIELISQAVPARSA